MFSEMISRLQSGDLLPPTGLRNRLNAAITKKMGVLKMPPAMWPSDPKINPPTEHLLWAAVILNDRDSLQVVEGLAITEAYERRQARGNSERLDTGILIEQLTDKLLALAPNEEARKKLADNLKKQ